MLLIKEAQVPQVPQANLPAELQKRHDEAVVAKAEADAAKAEADAAKAQADAAKAQQDADEHDSANATRERDAKADKAVAEAERDATAARRASITALVPDLSKVEKSTLTVKDGPNLGTSLLTFGALRDLALQIAERLVPDPANAGTAQVLVTSEEDLATSDAIYHEVVNRLTELRKAADALLPETEPTPSRLQGMGPVPALDLAAGVAAAVPAVLSLFTAQRTLSTATVTVGNLAAAVEVAGAIKARTPAWVLIHDNFRLLQEGTVYALADEVAERREKLVARKLELARKKTEAATELDRATQDVKLLEKELAKSGKTPAPDLQQRLSAARKALTTATAADTRLRAFADAIDSALTSIDTFVTAIHTTPAGDKRPPIATAALHEALHSTAGGFTHVLLVRTEGGESQQLLDNKPLWWNDKYSSVVDVSVTYALISVPDSSIVVAGTVTGTASASGKIGDPPRIKVEVRNPQARL